MVKTSDQIRSVAQSCLTLWNPMNHSTPGLCVHHQLPEFTETHVHRVSDAIQPSHPLSSPSPLAPNPSQHQSLFKWVNPSHEVAKVLEFQSSMKIILGSKNMTSYYDVTFHNMTTFIKLYTCILFLCLHRRQTTWGLRGPWSGSPLGPVRLPQCWAQSGVIIAFVKWMNI